ncbi:Nuclear pore complex protein NUP107 [Vitis vinifera]|uniref:Nuclear pore complex protein n=1 Tax=Vitis vinifera TaxID=29760 RepID=A0A438EWS8_VITVI|nr:Nuclear pore complex protein NUP107 [Vitis vinifera]
MRRRLALWKRQYISKGGRVTLIKSTLASMPIYQLSPLSNAQDEKGGLGIRRIALLNKVLLGKWLWRFAFEKDKLWKKVIMEKFGQEGLGWRTNEACGTFGVGVWKEILKEADWCWDNIEFKVAHRNATVNEVWDPSFGQGSWNISFSRDFNDWEVDLVGSLLSMLRDYKISSEEDSVFWKGGGSGIFRVKEAYNLLLLQMILYFRKRNEELPEELILVMHLLLQSITNKENQNLFPTTSHLEACQFVANDHTAQLCLRIVQWLEGLASKALDLENKVRGSHVGTYLPSSGIWHHTQRFLKKGVSNSNTVHHLDFDAPTREHAPLLPDDKVLLYMTEKFLLTKVLANRLKKVMGKEISKFKNAFMEEGWKRLVTFAGLLDNHGELQLYAHLGGLDQFPSIESLMKNGKNRTLQAIELESGIGNQWRLWKWLPIVHQR